jgi:hypothetical protein
MNQLKFFYYEFNFKLKSKLDTDFNNFKDTIEMKLLRPSFQKELRSSGENIFVSTAKISYDHITIRYIDVNMDISNRATIITNKIKECLEKDKELQKHIDFISMSLEEYQCPANFPNNLSGEKEDSYILLTSSNNIKYLYINNNFKASGNDALKMSYSIYERTGLLPITANLKFETSSNFNHMPMNLFDINKEDIEFIK